MSKRVFAFDLGKVSIGYCAREDNELLDVGSIIIDLNHSSVEENRNRRRTKRTRDSHKAREVFFVNEVWIKCGLSPLSKDDKRFTKEFSKDETIYNSCLLRIALLQNHKLEQWQIFKALFNAIQRRGYDPNIAWKNASSKDDEENEKYTNNFSKYVLNPEANPKEYKYEDLIKNVDYKFPCYYDALRLNLWSEENPTEFKKQITNMPLKVRDKGMVAPRYMVEAELKQLFINAQKQLPQLQAIAVEEFLYGEYEKAYASYNDPKFMRYRGTKKDWQGVLGQKIPRFDNRIISKCKLMPNRNVCSADSIENILFSLLIGLKNFRYSLNCEKLALTVEQINLIYANKLPKWLELYNSLKKNDKNPNFTVSKTDIESIIGKKKISEKVEIKANISGRSSFCRPALKLVNEIILSGKAPKDIDYSKFIDRNEKGINKEELESAISLLGESWEKIHISDNRNERALFAKDDSQSADLLIGNITNPVVRNRLQIFKNTLLKLKAKYGEPDEIVLEFIRSGADNSLYGRVKANSVTAHMKQQEKENERIAEKLKEINAFSPTNFLKLKLAEMQNNVCIYSGRPISISDLSKCEIDHILPRSKGGNDSLYNTVLCYSIENQNKGDKVPREYISADKWLEYSQRLIDLKPKLGKKKLSLLCDPMDKCLETIESYNALAETAQIARVAQDISAFIFGWGLQVKDEKRRVFVSNGSETAQIRKKYGLNKLLGNDIKKNRSNNKHHALDAICISYSREYKYNRDKNSFVIENFNPDIVKTAIDNLVPYPYSNDKQVKKELSPLETIYGKRTRSKNGKEITYLTVRKDITVIDQKEKAIKNILDNDIQNDLLEKLNDNLQPTDWVKMLSSYIHPKKKTKVKKVRLVDTEGFVEKDSNGRERIGEYCDFGHNGTMGQFKHSKRHTGQIIYFDKKGNAKVKPIYANQKKTEAIKQLQNEGFELYRKGEMFYSGCLVNIPKEFICGKSNFPSGIYLLKSLWTDGPAKLELNNGVEIISSAKNLAEAKFRKLNKK